MFKYFNDEWNEKDISSSDLDLPGMERLIKSADTSEEQKKIQPK